MASTKPLILTINAGSSSIRFALFRASDRPQRILGVVIERIGQPQATPETKGPDLADHASWSVNAPDHTVSVDVSMDDVRQRPSSEVMAAMTLRAVQGRPNSLLVVEETGGPGFRPRRSRCGMKPANGPCLAHERSLAVEK